MNYKLTFLMMLFSAIIVTAGCRTPKQITEETNNSSSAAESIDLDTFKSTQTTRILINKIDSTHTEIIIHQSGQEIASKHHRERNDSTAAVNSKKKDSLTPKLQKQKDKTDINKLKLANKKNKDSLNHQVKMEKQATKQKKIEHSNTLEDKLWTLGAILVAIWLLVNRKRFLNN